EPRRSRRDRGRPARRSRARACHRRRAHRALGLVRRRTRRLIMPPGRQGPLVYVMGPSGAGKDSVLNRARALLASDAPVVFADRYITRPAEAGGENHIALSAEEFDLRRTHGLFAFDWQAHGNRYGIGCEIHAWRQSGLTVVVSGSREHFCETDG